MISQTLEADMTKLSDIERKRRYHVLRSLSAQLREQIEPVDRRLEWKHVDCSDRLIELLEKRKPREA